jgi:hypothetical protein
MFASRCGWSLSDCPDKGPICAQAWPADLRAGGEAARGAGEVDGPAGHAHLLAWALASDGRPFARARRHGSVRVDKIRVFSVHLHAVPSTSKSKQRREDGQLSENCRRAVNKRAHNSITVICLPPPRLPPAWNTHVRNSKLRGLHSKPTPKRVSTTIFVSHNTKSLPGSLMAPTGTPPPRRAARRGGAGSEPAVLGVGVALGLLRRGF